MKYELTEETDYRQGSNGEALKVYQIRAKKSFKVTCAYYSIDVKEGDLGGYVASEKNLSQDGTCWLSEAAAVYEDARVTDDALVTGYANVYGHAVVEKQARVGNNSRVYGNAVVTDNARVNAVSLVFHNALVAGTPTSTESRRFSKTPWCAAKERFWALLSKGTRYLTITTG